MICLLVGYVAFALGQFSLMVLSFIDSAPEDASFWDLWVMFFYALAWPVFYPLAIARARGNAPLIGCRTCHAAPGCCTCAEAGRDAESVP